jgi:hypothetical protein
MTLGELVDRCLREIGETSTVQPVTYSRQEARDALNEAQRLFALFTLCLEAEGTLTTTVSGSFYYVSSQIPDFLAPLRILTPGRLTVRPSTLGHMEALNQSWRITPGLPKRYAVLGWDLLALDPRPDAAYLLPVQYAKSPAKLVTDGQSPEIPAEDHEALLDCAIPVMRLKEGGSQLAKVLPRFEAFLAAVKRRADYVRARSRDNQYDSLPAELKVTDLSRLLKKRAS